MDKERIYYKVLTSYKVLIVMLYLRDLHAIERKLRERERERSRRDALSTTHETQARRGFTIDFTFYKVLIIMLMSLMFTADLYYIPKIACVFSEPNEVRKQF